MPRTVGLRGRRPQKQPADRFAIPYLHEIITLPPRPDGVVDVSQGIADYGMLGNGPDPTLTDPPAGVDPSQGVGDCVPAAVAHDTMLSGAKPTANEVVAAYWAYDHDQDDGVNIADYLHSLWIAGDIEGFYPVEKGTEDAVMAFFGRGVLLGVNLTDSDQQRFSDHETWTCSGGETPDPQLGHGILMVKSDTASGPWVAVTWALGQQFDASWRSGCVEELWFFLTEADKAKMTPEQFDALIAALAGLPQAQVTPQPAPAPEPSPTPVPEPVPPVVPPAPEPAPQPAPQPTPGPQGFIERIRALAHELHRLEEDVLAYVEGNGQ